MKLYILTLDIYYDYVYKELYNLLLSRGLKFISYIFKKKKKSFLIYIYI